ncbi:zinc phosphodiesterase ELAC protein 2 isoform X1 [Scophthalmus maximus]|uniref:zinc phosphodiesterase ELAC protein 2 isoform X1 n=2 Tax=Scophthalmus maximus TaxID=52904 RepID=UPI001FA8C01A|nr:zinc phosphodiesterase ELAC protein 2 isoform X1 [Scophthalmus maximus]
MNTLHLKLRCFTFQLVKSGAAAAARRGPQTVSHFFRTMATNNNNSNSSSRGHYGDINNAEAWRQQPRPKKQNEPLRRLKTKEKRSQRGDVHGPSTVYLQVVGAGSRDQTPSLYVFSEYNRYLFNCGEGTQRLMQEHKLKAARLDNIFLTRMSWNNVGGLSGMILTLKDTGVPECVVSGPLQLENYINAIKSFSGPLGEIKLSVRPYTEETHTDDTMTVHQVPVFAQLKDRAGSSSASRSPASPKRDDVDFVDAGRHSPGERRTATRDPSLVVAFICKLHPRKGNFLVTQARELGLPVGTPAIGRLITALKAGNSITFEGKEIRPEQVCTPTDPGPLFIVVECPSEEFVEAVCTNQRLRRHQTGGTENGAALVVHMTPESVLETDQYKEWMERFPSTTEHLILNEHVCTHHNIRSHKIQAQLNMIHPEIFPELRSYKAKEPQATLHVPNVRAECLLKFQLRPVVRWQRDAIPSCDADEFVKEASEVPNFLEEVEKSRKICSAAAEPSGRGEKYPEVVFLGTGSALPMKMRNVSGTLVNISPSQSMLLDCGEGTFGQLCRHYGDDVDDALTKITTVFISHMHADHHTGLLNLLYQRERAVATLGKDFSPVFLIAPTQIMTWLNQYHDHCEEIVHHVNLVPNACLRDDGEPLKQPTQSLVEALLRKNDLKEFQTCTVRHCKNAFACCFTHQSGWKLAFSGDTMPCDWFVHMGRNATLLIHEATLEDGLEQEAVEKRHSTTSQAIGIGVKMNAEFIMLNHFSQRYAKIPLFSEDFDDKVGISFDHMRIHYGDFKILPRLIPALKTLFAEEIEEMEERREKRELKQPRGSSYEEAAEAAAGRGAKREQEEAATRDAEAKRQKTH